MRITQVDSQLLRFRLNRTISLLGQHDVGERVDHAFLLLVHLDTDAGLRGLGFTYAMQGGGRAMQALIQDDLAPWITGQDPLDHERLAAKAAWRLQGVGPRGLAMQAYAAIDLALWDLKGKAANLPLYKVLGGARESAPVYGSDVGWLGMSAQQIVDASRPYLDDKMMGVKIQVGSPDPEQDAERVQHVRDALGEETWLAVDAGQRYDYGTALAMGRFFEEEIGIDWYEEPLACEDVEGHARLASKLDAPIAVGASLLGANEFQRYLERDAAAVLQPDVARLGGLTVWLKVAALAELHHRRLSTHLLPELAVHLACGLPHVIAVEYTPWFFPIFQETPSIVSGRITPLQRPGLGLEINPDAIERYRVATA